MLKWEGDPAWRNAAWAMVAFLFVAFYHFQWEINDEGAIQAYWVFWFIPIHNATDIYAYRTIFAFFLFFAPALWLFPRFVRNSFLALTLVSTTLFFGVVQAGLEIYDVKNDRSQAIQVAVQNVREGKHPYSAHPGQQPITPLTMTILLGVPTELLFKRPELATLPILLFGFFLLAWHRWRVRSPIPLEVLACLLFLNPVVVHELIWGSDLLWGGVLLLASFCFLDAGRTRTAAVFFALTLCTRSSYFMLVPMWGIYLWRTLPRPVFTRRVLLVLGVVAFLLLPVALWNPKIFFGYAPIGYSKTLLMHDAPQGENLLGDLMNRALPGKEHRPWVASMIMLAVSVLLGFRARCPRTLALCTATLLGLMLLLMAGKLFPDYFSWLVFPLLFAMLGSAGSDSACRAETRRT
jgi:hypothetical protein